MMSRPVPGDKDRIISSKRTNRCSRINDRDTLAVKIDPQVVNVSFTTDMLRVVLADGREVSVPLAWFPRLQKATAKQRKNPRLIGGGGGGPLGRGGGDNPVGG